MNAPLILKVMRQKVLIDSTYFLLWDQNKQSNEEGAIVFLIRAIFNY